ncbi:MAG: aminopeptidase P family protein [Anaerolineales bacterium]|nr:aminopeptidase P family protein [Anaerolineales bacterium]
MRSDLDQLMQERGYAALLVLGGTACNPPMYYLANGASVTENTVLVKPRGQAPLLFVSAMERDEAACSGLEVRARLHRLAELRTEAGGSEMRARARWLVELLAEAGVRTGAVAAFGQIDLGSGYALLTAIGELNPRLKIVGGLDDNLLDLVRTTKDAHEAGRIRAVGRRTMRVVAGTEEFLTSHRARNGHLVHKDGSRLTIGDVKRRIRELLLAENLVDPESGAIFAIGRDAGVPHSRGRDRDPVALGQTILYDIFPAEPGGGYFFDFTRTWCLGFAPPEVEQAHADVLDTFKRVRRALKPGELCRGYQDLTCDLLEARGHPTLRTDPTTTNGYVHSVAHGLGLAVHEAPRFHSSPSNGARLDPGVVITIEPGLYYPERGFGVRIEDSLWLNPATLKFETLANYHKDLVLNVKR